jgi:hypothetical protein
LRCSQLTAVGCGYEEFYLLVYYGALRCVDRCKSSVADLHVRLFCKGRGGRGVGEGREAPHEPSAVVLCSVGRLETYGTSTQETGRIVGSG